MESYSCTKLVCCVSVFVFFCGFKIYNNMHGFLQIDCNWVYTHHWTSCYCTSLCFSSHSVPSSPVCLHFPLPKASSLGHLFPQEQICQELVTSADHTHDQHNYVFPAFIDGYLFHYGHCVCVVWGFASRCLFGVVLDPYSYSSSSSAASV